MQDTFYYLDNAATTKMFDDVAKEASIFLTEKFFNPSAVYAPAVQVKREILEAKKSLLNCLGTNQGDLIFTGSATESNNTVIMGLKNNGKRFLFGAGEHPSVKECAIELSKRGYKVEFIPLNADGEIDIEKYKNMLDENVGFISVQHVSNETGAVNPIAKLVKLARKYNKNVLFHSDGVQAFMKFPYSLLDLDVDFYTVSAHKIYGPKGVGALYIKKGSKINPYIYGGGQENSLRSGTENVFGIVAFKMCAEKMLKDRDNNYKISEQMNSSLLKELSSLGIEAIVHGKGIPNTINVCLSKQVRGETLVHALEARGVYVSTGSACSATKNYNSTLEAMGIDSKEILSSIRISFSPYMQFDAKIIAKIIKEELDKFIK